MCMSVIKIKDDNNNFVDVETIRGSTGPAGATGATGPAGQGIPTGGEEGQILVKSSDANYDTEWADQYKVGDIFVTPEGESPTYPGSYSLVSQIAGGGLIAYGFSIGGSGSTVVQEGSVISYSDDEIPKKMYDIKNFVDGILTFESGTFYCHPQGIVGMVEATMQISGFCSSLEGGIWTRGNLNTLPSGVISSFGTVAGGMESHPLYSFGTANGYGGFTINVLYSFPENSVTESFYINPSFTPYRCNFTPGGGGTGCQLIVKVYAKKGILLDVWKKTG